MYTPHSFIFCLLLWKIRDTFSKFPKYEIYFPNFQNSGSLSIYLIWSGEIMISNMALKYQSRLLPRQMFVRNFVTSVAEYWPYFKLWYCQTMFSTILCVFMFRPPIWIRTFWFIEPWSALKDCFLLEFVNIFQAALKIEMNCRFNET